MQEASAWEPADLLPRRVTAGRPQQAAHVPPEAMGGREVRPGAMPTMRAPQPRADSQCGSASDEEHVAKLVLEARQADECAPRTHGLCMLLSAVAFGCAVG